MNENNSNDRSSFARRIFLKATGSATTLGLAGISGVQADPGKSIGSGHVAKAELELPDLPELSASATYPIVHWDSPMDHLVHDGQLYFLESASETELHAAKRSQAIVRNERFRPMDPELFGRGVGEIPTSLGWAMQRSYELELVDEYEVPPVTLRPTDDEDLRVEGPAVGGTVPAGTERRLDLPAQEVELRVERPTDETVDRPDIPERLRGVKIERWIETVTIEPELVVRNHGRLKYVDATDEVTVNTN